MASVREATFALLRAHGMTTIFGNPGSTEVSGRDELTAALREAMAAEDGPRLVQVRVGTGMWLD